MSRRFLALAIVALLMSAPAPGRAADRCAGHLRFGRPGWQGVFLCRRAFALSYSPERKIPLWVGYRLSRDRTRGPHSQAALFRPDPALRPEARAELADYRGSGYDRGHMAPAADMRWSAAAMAESFYLSNVAPQIGPGFNRSIWSALERRVRAWARRRGEIFVVTGSVFDGPARRPIGRGRVAVPTHFFKVIYDPGRGEAIAFLLPHRRLRARALPRFIRSVDTVEAKTGLDFLSRLPDKAERRIEARRPVRMWAR